MWSETVVLGSNLVSDVAAASFIPHSPYSPQLASWLKCSADFYGEIEAQHASAGVVLRTGIEFRESSQRPWFEDCIRDLEQCSSLASLGIQRTEKEAFKPNGGWKYTTFLIEPRFFIPWLRLQLESLGVTFKHAKITDWSDISADYDVIVNCTAIGARILEKDEETRGVGGQILVARFTGLNYWIRDKSDSKGISYIYPQRNTVVLGGTSSNELRKDENTLKEEILKGCVVLDPNVSKLPLIGVNGHYRPYRPSFRLEIDNTRSKSATGAILIHNYGHGGEGYCFGPGCAEHVVELVSKSLNMDLQNQAKTPLVKLQRMKTKL